MKARITHAVEIDSVPNEVRKQVECAECAIAHLHEINAAIKFVLSLDMSNEVNVDCVTAALTQLREELSSLDQDVLNNLQIMNGYKKYVASKKEEQERVELLEQALADKNKVQVQQEAEEPVIAPNPDSSLPSEFVKKMMEMSNDNKG